MHSSSWPITLLLGHRGHHNFSVVMQDALDLQPVCLSVIMIQTIYKNIRQLMVTAFPSEEVGNCWMHLSAAGSSLILTASMLHYTDGWQQSVRLKPNQFYTCPATFLIVCALSHILKAASSDSWLESPFQLNYSISIRLRGGQKMKRCQNWDPGPVSVFDH